jgi:hypothetical protein
MLTSLRTLALEWRHDCGPASQGVPCRKSQVRLELCGLAACTGHLMQCSEEGFFFVVWNLNSGLSACKADTLYHLSLQSILLGSFWRWGFVKYLPRLASNCDLSDLSLPSS